MHNFSCLDAMLKIMGILVFLFTLVICETVFKDISPFILAIFNMSSENVFNFDESKIVEIKVNGLSLISFNPFPNSRF